jgi:small subunit ribosomal protein S21
MVVVTRKKGETKDSMFRKFSRVFMEENIVDELRKKQFYKKPSLKKKEEEKERIKMRARRKRYGSFFSHHRRDK